MHLQKFRISILMVAMPFYAAAQGLPRLNIELQQHQGINVPETPVRDYFRHLFERLINDPTAITIIVVAIAFFVYFRKKRHAKDKHPSDDK